jgi:hypothetical protein
MTQNISHVNWFIENFSGGQRPSLSGNLFPIIDPRQYGVMPGAAGEGASMVK